MNLTLFQLEFFILETVCDIVFWKILKTMMSKFLLSVLENNKLQEVSGNWTKYEWSIW